MALLLIDDTVLLAHISPPPVYGVQAKTCNRDAAQPAELSLSGGASLIGRLERVRRVRIAVHGETRRSADPFLLERPN